MRAFLVIATLAIATNSAFADETTRNRRVAPGFSITEAIRQAVNSNPGVTEAAANRRATEAELRQTQSTLLPQVRLQAEWGPEKITRHDIVPPPAGDGQWQKNSREGSIIVRQLLFDGLASLNEIWRQSARVDAAAARVHERTELIALDAAEAYIDVVRYGRLIALGEENVAALRSIVNDVKQRYDGGRSGEGDYQQALERLADAEAVLAEFKQRLEDAYAKYRRAVGLEPNNLRFPGRLPGLPRAKDDSLAIALRHNPTLRAAGADVIAAKYGFRATAGAFMPTVSLEGRATRGYDTDNILGKRDDVSGKVVMSWDVFRGGQDSWRRTEMAERMIEQTQRQARLQRDAFESLDKAWAARTVTGERLAFLIKQSQAARKVIEAYSKEYELGQRTLIDLLIARNQYFNSLVAIVSTRAVAVFADYQLLATMGHLLEYIKTAPPPEADPMAVRPFGLFPYRLPPLLIKDPDIAPRPLNVNGGSTDGGVYVDPPKAAFWAQVPVAANPAGSSGLPVVAMPSGAGQPLENTASIVENRWPSPPIAFAPAPSSWGPFSNNSAQ